MNIIHLAKKITKKIISYLKISFLKFKYENTFEGEDCVLKYLFFPSESSDKLLVVFSGFPGKNEHAKYNYIRTFQDINYNKLYILDNYGPDKRGGSYYLGKNKDDSIEKNVAKLINFIAVKQNISKKNIFTAGSSKGGYASLYFSIKYGYGAAIAGAPQIILGNYLKKDGHQPYLTYITGEFSDENITYLNSLLFDAIKGINSIPDIFIHVGKGDHHYSDHVVHLCKYLDKENIPYKLDLQDYKKHGDVGKFFPPFAMKCLEILDKKRNKNYY